MNDSTLRATLSARAEMSGLLTDIEAKRGPAVTAFIKFFADLAYLSQTGICPKHGTPECTCDPGAEIETAIKAIHAINLSADQFAVSVLPHLLGKATLEPTDQTAVIDDIGKVFNTLVDSVEAIKATVPNGSTLEPEDLQALDESVEVSESPHGNILH